MTPEHQAAQSMIIKLVTLDEANELYFRSKPPAYWLGLDQSDNHRHLQWEDPKPRWKKTIISDLRKLADERKSGK